MDGLRYVAAADKADADDLFLYLHRMRRMLRGGTEGKAGPGAHPAEAGCASQQNGWSRCKAALVTAGRLTLQLNENELEWLV